MCKTSKIKMGAPTIEEFMTKFKDEKAARNYLLKFVYPNGELVCPLCGCTTRVYVGGRKNRRKPREYCGHCMNDLNSFSGTMFENTRILYKTWLQIMYSMFISRRSVSSRQLVRETGVSEPSIYHIRRLVQMAMSNYDLEPFSGNVDMDEVYLGGSNHGRYARNNESGEKKKYPVFGICEESTGRVYSHVAIPNAKGQYLTNNQIKDFVEKTCKPGATIVSDEWKSYKVFDKADSQYHHEAVDHSCEFSNDNGYTSARIESYWAEIKKMYYSTHSFFTKQYAHFYLSETDFRHNHKDWQEALETIITQGVFTPRVIDVRQMGKFGNRTYNLKDYRMILPRCFDEIPLEQITVKDILDCDEPVYGILREPYQTRKQRRMGLRTYKDEWAVLGYIKGGIGYKDYRNTIVNSEQDIEDMLKDATKHKEVNCLGKIKYPSKPIPKDVMALRKRRNTMKRRYARMPKVIQQQIKREYPKMFDCSDPVVTRKIHDRITVLIFQYKKYVEATGSANEIAPYKTSHTLEERRKFSMKKRYESLPKEIQKIITSRHPNILEVSDIENTTTIHKELNKLMRDYKHQQYLEENGLTEEDLKNRAKEKKNFEYFNKRYNGLPESVRLQITTEYPNLLEIDNYEETVVVRERMNALVKAYKRVLERGVA